MAESFSQNRNAFARATILIVDDQPINVMALSRLFEGEYYIQAATNGIRALELARGATPPALILLDIQMPDMDGYEVCRQLQADQRTRGIPIVFLTARDAEADEEEGLKLGAVDYLSKPYTPSIVKARVRQQIERKLIESRVAESEANFRAFFNSMQDMVIVGSPDGRVLYANEATISKLGYTLEELDELGILGVHPVDRQIEAEDIFAAMFRGERNFCPLPLQCKNGTLIPVETRVSFGKWDGKDSVFGISKDMSIEQEALHKFDLLFDMNPAMMALSRLPERRYTRAIA